jgi:hypothetical protein
VAPTSDGSSTSSLLRQLDENVAAVSTIPVHISYEIIRLFSEGLYQSPQKAVEELVSNGYDAGAENVHVLLPEQHTSGTLDLRDDALMDPLWVIDDGHGMDAAGFAQLWRVAYSGKASVETEPEERAPIGQFGIGKLAAYVLAWQLTHISCVNGQIRYTSMDFRRLTGRHQYDNNSPLDLSLRELSEEQAKELLGSVEHRDAVAWDRMFGSSRSRNWTAAGLSDFKDLYDKLAKGRLSWVLSTGLPLHSQFNIWLNGVRITSSKETAEIVASYGVGGEHDSVAKSRGIRTTETGMVLPGINGEISGQAVVYKNRITHGKSEQYGRSHGFFVRVRGRVINLEDELFGLDALNHAVWSRFSMEINADGLRDHLLSSREGVRESEAIHSLRRYLHGVFNFCRARYEEWQERELVGLDVQRLLKEAPSTYVTEPMEAGVRRVVETHEESFYVAEPDIPPGVDAEEWLQDFSQKISTSMFERILFEKTGVFDRVVRYVPDTRTLIVNEEHPFVEKLLEIGRNRAGATLFGSSELLIDVLLQEQGLSKASIVDFLADRDRTLRLVAGESASTAAEVLRLLRSAASNDVALERAIGKAFRVLGFEYERRGGYEAGADGVLYARLGRGTRTLADYKIVYDSKQSNSPAVKADKINVQSLEDFRSQESADYGFFFAVAYEGQADPTAKLNRTVAAAAENGARVTLFRGEDLRRLVELHYRYGVTLTRLRSLFETCHTVPEVTTWVDGLEHELAELRPQVPLALLLEGLEREKVDQLARPSVKVVRSKEPELLPFEPEELTTTLQAVQTIVGDRWIEVDNEGDVRLHGSAAQIVAEVERHLRALLGVNALGRGDEKA